MPGLGVLVGMTAEAACLAPLGAAARIAFSGAQAALARRRTEALVAEGAAGLVSFGIAGALVPDRRPGRLLLPPTVVGLDRHDAWPVDRRWHRLLAERAMAAGLVLDAGVSLCGSDRPVTTAADKAALAAVTGAAAVDMESHIVAAVARAHGLPFLVLRAIADPAERAIPAPALAGLGADGQTRPWAVAARLLAAPWTLPALIRLAADSAAALAALAEAIRRLGPQAFLDGLSVATAPPA